jgi:hypothetical protein
MKIHFIHDGVAKTANIEPAEYVVSNTEFRVWTEKEFRERFFPGDPACRKAYEAYRKTYRPPVGTEVGRVLELLQAGRLAELEKKYRIRIDHRDDGNIRVDFVLKCVEKKSRPKPIKRMRKKPTEKSKHKRLWVTFVQGGAPGLGKRA